MKYKIHVSILWSEISFLTMVLYYTLPSLPCIFSCVEILRYIL